MAFKTFMGTVDQIENTKNKVVTLTDDRNQYPSCYAVAEALNDTTTDLTERLNSRAGTDYVDFKIERLYTSGNTIVLPMTDVSFVYEPVPLSPDYTTVKMRYPSVLYPNRHYKIKTNEYIDGSTLNASTVSIGNISGIPIVYDTEEYKDISFEFDTPSDFPTTEDIYITFGTFTEDVITRYQTVNGLQIETELYPAEGDGIVYDKAACDEAINTAISAATADNATKDYVNSAISAAVGETLNKEV